MPLALASLGLIAGNQTLPLLFAQQARRAGVKRLVGVAFRGETNPALEQSVDEIIWLKVGQLSKLISAFQDRGITQCVMLGQIAPKNLFDLRPDLRTIGLLARLERRNAHTLFGGIAAELKKDGIELIPALPWLKPLMAQAGFHLGPKLSEPSRADVQFGFSIAKEIARLEIGQLVVVKSGTVLAVEAFEGTDACLARGGGLAGEAGGATAVKVAKDGHDLRFDIPCIGPKTIETCHRSRVSTFAMESGLALVLEPQAVERLARRHKIAIVVASG